MMRIRRPATFARNCVDAAADGLTLKPCPSDFVPTVGKMNKLVSNVAMALKFSAAGYSGGSDMVSPAGTMS